MQGKVGYKCLNNVEQINKPSCIPIGLASAENVASIDR